MPELASQASELLRQDDLRWHLLGVAASLDLPDCWIGAGFVRDAIWDHLEGHPISRPSGDIDVIWFDPNRSDAATDRALEDKLTAIEPAFAWSVKNQARMHLRNGDPAYSSATDAMRFWPESATAIAARRFREKCIIAAPLGLHDLFAMQLRPAGRFVAEKRSVFEERIQSKNWLCRWPSLKLA